MKPLRPFPFPINVGIDICQISRIYRLLTSPHATRFVNRILAPEEVARHHARLQALTRVHVLEAEGLSAHESLATRDPELWKCASFMAGRFAAKEATIKAHSFRRLSLHDVVIERRTVEGTRLGSGPPVARIKNTEQIAEMDESAMISISHDGDYATAICMAYDPGTGGGSRKMDDE